MIENEPSNDSPAESRAETSAASASGAGSGPPPKPNRFGPLKLHQILALAAAILAAFVMREFLRDSSQGSQEDRIFSGPLVGEIQSVEGQVMIRPPRGTRFDAAKPGPFRAESVLQTQAASAAVIEFRPGPTIRLLENSRLVAELDTSRDGAIQATVLAGEVTILNPGTNPLFALLHNGVSINFRDGEVPMPRTVPLIQIGPSTDGAATSDLEEKLEIEKESEISAAPPSTDLDSISPGATPTSDESTSPEDPRPKKLPAKNESGLLRSTLTNDDIRTQLRSQAGSFQKCYVTMVNRMSESGVARQALPKGEIRVSFKIQPTGKIEDAKILHSPFKDATFERCAADALSRMRFRQFQGAAIPVGEFPIILE